MKAIEAWSLGADQWTVRAELAPDAWLHLEASMGGSRIALPPSAWVDLVTILSGYVVAAARELERNKVMAETSGDTPRKAA